MRRTSKTSRRPGRARVAGAGIAGLVVSLLGLATVDAAVAPDAPAGVTKARSEEDHYTAEIRPEGRYTVSKEGTVEVVVTAKGDFHLDPQFPIKFKVDKPSDGITIPKDVLRREDGKFDERGGSFHVPFTAGRAGTFLIGGTVSLSVCNEKRCVMEKVPLDLEVTVQ